MKDKQSSKVKEEEISEEFLQMIEESNKNVEQLTKATWRESLLARYKEKPSTILQQKLKDYFDKTNSQSMFKYFLPSKRREEVLGDLMETKHEMIEDDLPMWKVKVVLFFHMVMILLSMIRLKLVDYGRSKKKFIK